jgi:phenylalanine-4-hydroxylase
MYGRRHSARVCMDVTGDIIQQGYVLIIARIHWCTVLYMYIRRHYSARVCMDVTGDIIQQGYVLIVIRIHWCTVLYIYSR